MEPLDIFKLPSDLIGEDELNQVGLIQIHSLHDEFVVFLVKDPAIEY